MRLFEVTFQRSLCSGDDIIEMYFDIDQSYLKDLHARDRDTRHNINSDSFPQLATILQGNGFYRERNKLCFDAALALFNHNQDIDQITLAGQLARTGLLEAAGGMAYLMAAKVWKRRSC